MSATRTRIDREVSLRIDVLKILLMVMVVMIHAEKGVQAYVDPVPPVAEWVVLFFGHNLCRAAVPLFFTISAYLLFSTFETSPAAYLKMLKKRVRSVLVPFLLVNLFFMALILVFHKIPYIGDLNYLKERGYFEILVGIGGHPVDYTLWFLRDLMIYFLLAPVFDALAREAPITGLIALYLIWNLVPQGGIPIEFSGAFFFYLGCFLARTDFPVKTLCRFKYVVGAVWLVLAVFGIHLEYANDLGAAFFLAHRLNLALGVCLFWCVSAIPAVRDNAFLHKIAPYAFFVYLAHEPTLSYLIYVTRFLFELWRPSGVFGTVFYYFLLTALTFGIALGLGRLLARRLPRVYAVITGGRAPS